MQLWLRMWRPSEGQVQAQLGYLQAQINELANSMADQHKRMDSLRMQLYHLTRTVHKRTLNEWEQRCIMLQALDTAAHQNPEGKRVCDLNTLDD